MGYGGYFAYRYKRTYYRQYLQYDVEPYDSGHGQRLASMVPRDPSAFKENPFDDVVHPDDGVGADDLGFNVVYEPDLEWFKLSDRCVNWTYTIDLDNLVFTINGTVHLRLDNMPPDLEDYTYHEDGDVPVPQEYLCPKVDLWPAPNFDTEECQQRYKALQPIIVPATEWGASPWNELTASQRFSIEITHYLLDKTSAGFTYAYAPFIRTWRDIDEFCWNMLCASVPALPVVQEDKLKGVGYIPFSLMRTH
ncbi:hypothetical protein RSOL_420650 [Rhizoctonia solani AG-3 Rhs1AP]|uniref:Uncharacterized protein n=1 Tax=Rhizoctonia solani AG-3 Rhs1AP TaxID=1086054 RepID=X8JFE7_9AGAM|nr:hypothetical protein RSOL_420650 [Rhizoctonia solani AG-3 Rhs1AP]